MGRRAFARLAVVTSRLRPTLLAGVAAALLGLTACGGIAADAPTDAPIEDFCAASADIDRSAAEFAADLAETGTPEGVSDEVRNGFEVYIDALDGKGDEAYNDAINDLSVPEDEVGDGNAYIQYMTETCNDFLAGTSPGAGGESPTDQPTDQPTE